MSLRECMQSHTHREYLAWMDWLDRDLERPSRSDWYLMQLTTIVQRLTSKKPESVKIDGFKLKFREDGEKRRPRDIKRYSQEQRSLWTGLLNLFKTDDKGKNTRGQ